MQANLCGEGNIYMECTLYNDHGRNLCVYAHGHCWTTVGLHWRFRPQFSQALATCNQKPEVDPGIVPTKKKGGGCLEGKHIWGYQTILPNSQYQSYQRYSHDFRGGFQKDSDNIQDVL